MNDIIDFHSHIYPDRIAKMATKGVADFYNIEINTIGNVDNLLKNGKEAGINKFVVQAVATRPKQVKRINNFFLEKIKAYPENLIGFASIHPYMENPLEEIQRVLNLGFKGIKLHPDSQNFNIDCEEMFEIYDLIQGKVPVLIHCGDYRYDFSHPKRLVNVLKLFPNLTVIAAHLGGWSIWDEALDYLLNQNCYLDTSSSFVNLGKEKSLKLVKAYGAERLVFGVDFPMGSHKKELDMFFNLGLSDEENSLILSQNSKNILNLT